MDYQKTYEEWLASPYIDEKTKAELKGIGGDENEIRERFYTELSSGLPAFAGLSAPALTG